MNINGIRPEILRSDTARDLKRGGGESDSKQSVTQPASPAERGDKVQISDAGRALAAQAAEGSNAARGELTPERVSEIRHRILSGAYNSLDVVEQVARKMLASGDI